MSGDIIRIGFVPLVDCALLAVAQEQGFFARQRVDVELRKAQSWGQVRDKLQTGELDASHVLLTMPLQAALAARGTAPILYAFTLSRNGNGIILSNALWNEGMRDGSGLAKWMSAKPGAPVRLGVVFPRGTQEYFLRSWLARGGLALGDRITLSIIPPQEMVGRLRKGEIDGFCAGEPWTRRAAASKLGRLVSESGALLPGLGEKVLGVRADWHRGHTLEHARLIRALAQASTWMADPGNFEGAVDIVASKRYVNTPRTVVEGALRDAQARLLPTAQSVLSRFLEGDLHAPAQSHARWYLDQMALWGHADPAATAALDLASVCLETFHHSATATAQSPAAPAVAGLPARA